MSRAGTIGALAALLAPLLAGCSAQPTPTPTSLPQGFTLKSVEITLPQETAVLPPWAEVVAINCAACHSPEMILSQPRLDAATWQKEIDKMRTAYHASIDAKDDGQLVAALVKLQQDPASRP